MVFSIGFIHVWINNLANVICIFKSEMRSGGKDVVTVTVQLAVWLPSSVATVIFALPVATPVTTPLLTVATDALFELHVTFCLQHLLARQWQ